MRGLLYLALFHASHGSSHARSTTASCDESSQNVHYIELLNLWVGQAHGVCVLHARA